MTKGKIKLKSGEKDFKISHKTIYNLKKNTGKDIMDIVMKMEQKGTVELNDIYEILFAALDHDSIEELLDDLIDDKTTEYIELVSEKLGLLFGEKI